MNWKEMLPPDRLAKGMWWGEAWSLVGGCTPVSEGCANYWSADQANMRQHNPNEKVRAANAGLVTDRKFNGHVRCNESQLDKPLKIKKPTVFSIWNDLFHEDVPDEFIDRAFAVMALCPQHLFVILTKRPERMREYFNAPYDNREHSIGRAALLMTMGTHNGILELPLPNVVLGTSVENQATVDERIPHLLATWAACRFVSYEPALGPVDFKLWLEIAKNPHTNKIQKSGWKPDIHGIIVGGESGPKARPMHPQWARTVRDDCAAAGVSFFFKQNGMWILNPEPVDVFNRKARHFYTIPAGERLRRVGKQKAGRLLDGVEHNDLPTVRSGS